MSVLVPGLSFWKQVAQMPKACPILQHSQVWSRRFLNVALGPCEWSWPMAKKCWTSFLITHQRGTITHFQMFRITWCQPPSLVSNGMFLTSARFSNFVDLSRNLVFLAWRRLWEEGLRMRLSRQSVGPQKPKLHCADSLFLSLILHHPRYAWLLWLLVYALEIPHQSWIWPGHQNVCQSSQGSACQMARKHWVLRVDGRRVQM